MASLFHNWPQKFLPSTGYLALVPPECDRVLQQVKTDLVSSKVLVHYDSDLPITLATDASAYGVGVVISHIFPFHLPPVPLTPSERNYAQIDKKTLLVVFGSISTFLVGNSH